MKRKTSFSLDERTLEKVKAVAEREERSTSYIVEKIIETVITAAGEDTENFSARVKELADEYGVKARRVPRVQKKASRTPKDKDEKEITEEQSEK